MKKTIVLLIALTIISCSQKELVSVEVTNAQSSTVALFEGKYKVHFMNKEDLVVDFPISNDEIHRIKRAYVKQKIACFETNVLVVDNKPPYISPAGETQYILTFSDGSQQMFTVITNFQINPLDQEKYRELKIFLETIDTIIKSKPEIQNAEKSDVWYI